MVRTLVVTCLLCCAPLTCLAQAAPELPDSPAYRGEIRRSADGKLIAVEEKRAWERIAAYRPRLEGKKVLLITGGVKSWSVVSALQDLGMTVVATGTRKSTEEDKRNQRNHHER